MYSPTWGGAMDESEYQLGMARLMRITNRLKDDPIASQSPEIVGDHHICKICGYSWKIRRSSPEPKSCPSCRSRMWNSPFARNVVCARCGYKWRTDRDRPKMCPQCKSRTYDSHMLAGEMQIMRHRLGGQDGLAFRESHMSALRPCGEGFGLLGQT